MNKTTLAIFFGGRSPEHEVSLTSAREICKAINAERYNLLLILITKQGQWQRVVFDRDKHLFSRVADLSLLPTHNGLCFELHDTQALPKGDLLGADLTLNQVEVVFPIIHGLNGEDGSLQGLLQLFNLPHVGPQTFASASGMDKVASKKLFQSAGLPIVKFCDFWEWEVRCEGENTSDKFASLAAICERELTYPMFVKPSNSGSSVGITKTTTRSELLAAIAHAFNYDEHILVEQGVSHGREIEIAVLGNFPDLIASVCGEIKCRTGFYDYEKKYLNDEAELIVPAVIEPDTYQTIKRCAFKAFELINGSGMARIDFLLDSKGEVFLSEVNTVPGFTPISMYPKMLIASGIAYADLIDKLVVLALQTHRQQRRCLERQGQHQHATTTTAA